MKCFKDSTGREWRISLTLGSIDRVLDAAGVDLLEPYDGDPPLITRLRTNLRLMGRVLAEIMETDGDRQLVAAELRDAFDADTKVAAWEAFRQEWADFFRRDGRDELAPALDRQDDLIKASSQEAIKQINQIDVEAAIASVVNAGG